MTHTARPPAAPSRARVAAVSLALLLGLLGRAGPAVADYGDQGSHRLGAALGLGGGGGGFRYLAGVDWGYFVWSGVAPGLEASVSGGAGVLTTGMLLPNLHVLPLRTSHVALLLTLRAGRVLVADHADGWAAGGSAGVLLFSGGSLGLHLGYEALRFLPAGFCADFAQGCLRHGLVLGVIVGI